MISFLDTSPEKVRATFKLALDAYIKVVYRNAENGFNALITYEADLLAQKFFLHCMSLEKLSTPQLYQSSLMQRQFELLDPISVWALLRSQFEAYLAFHHLFVTPTSDEEREIRYKLWVVSGLKYRNRFPATIEAHIQQQERERKQIEELIEEIKQTPIYQGLLDEEKKKLKDIIKRKDWKVAFKDSHAISLSWPQLGQRTEMNQSLFSEIYNYLSIHSHPTYISVLQLGELYATKEDQSLALLGMNLSRFIISFMISDYCKFFVRSVAYFNELPNEYRAFINFYNSTFRGDHHMIPNKK